MIAPTKEQREFAAQLERARQRDRRARVRVMGVAIGDRVTVTRVDTVTGQRFEWTGRVHDVNPEFPALCLHTETERTWLALGKHDAFTTSVTHAA